jgi:hypothetical protein
VNATISKADALGTAEVLEMHNADLSDASVRGFTPILRGADGRLHYGVPERQAAPLAGHEHMQGAFDGYDLSASKKTVNLEAQQDRSKQGYMDAAMGVPMNWDACDDYRRGYRNYRSEDGARFGADAVADVQRITGYMRRDGLLPDRRIETPRAGYTLAHVVGWLAAPGIVAGLRALGGGA